MAVATPTNLTSGTKTADATSATTASISVTQGRLYLLSVASKTEITADPNQPTATGTGLTFAVPSNGTVVYDNSSSSRRRVTFLWARATATGSTTVVIDFGGQTQVTSVWSIEEIASGFASIAPIVQAAQNSSPAVAVTSITATLGAFGATGNITFGCGAIGNGTDTITVGASFTQLTQTKDATENNINLLTEYQMANDTTVNMSFTSQAECGIIGVEIKAEVIEFDAGTASGIKTAYTNFTFTHTCSTGNNRLLVITVQERGATADDDLTVTGITYNSVAMTKAIGRLDADSPTTGSLRSEIWYLVAPATGSNTVSVTTTGTVTSGCAFAASFTGVNQTSPVDITGGANGKGQASPITVTVTTVSTNAWLIDSLYNKISPGSLTKGANQTLVAAEQGPNAGGDSADSSYKGPLASGSNSMSYTFAGADDFSMVVMGIADINASSLLVSTARTFMTTNTSFWGS